MTSSARFEEAKKWIESIEPRWRLQILSKKFRIDPKTGERTDLPIRLRRFVEGVPWALVHDSIDYLISMAPYSGIIYNGVEIPGSYRPTVTSWTRDDKDQTVSKTSIKTNDGTYTLIQDLIEDRDSDFYGATTVGSCSEEAVTEWHWDSVSIEDMPVPSQGISYSIQAVNRNEDGTFDYALVRRTAKTQHSAEHIQSDGPFEKVTVETWDNVYGEPGAFSGVTVPESGTSGGVQTVVRISENSDCTFKIEVVRTTVKPNVSQARTTEKDQYAAKEIDVVKGASSALPNAPAASNGDTFKHESQLQPDGTYTTSRTKESELSVSDAVVEVSVGRKGRKETVTSRNVPIPAPVSVTVGGSVRNEKTPGGRFNTVVSSWVNNVRSLVGVVCRIDLFSHRHTVEKAGAGSLDDVDVSGSGAGGVVITKSTRMDDDGAVIESVETETERSVDDARETWVSGLFGVKHRVERRNMPSPLSAPLGGARDIGKTVVNERTPGGLYNTTEEGLDRTTDPITDSSGCEKTVFEHTDTTSTRNPDGSLPDHVSDAGGGKRHTISGSLNDDGSSTVRETTVKENKYEAALVTYRRTAKAFFRQTTDKNVSMTAQKPTKVGFSESHTTNPGGTHDLTKTVVEPTGCVDRSHSTDDSFSSERDRVTVVVGATGADDTPCTSSGSGKFYRKESVLDDDGVLTVTERETTEKTVESADVTAEKKPRGTVTTTINRSTDEDAEVGGANTMVRSTVTQGGRNDLVVRNASDPTIDSAYSHDDAFETVSDLVVVTVGGTPVANASGEQGVVQTVTSEVDLDGFVKKVTRNSVGKQFTYRSGGSSDGTSHSITNTIRGTSPVVGTGDSISRVGTVVTARSTKLQNGLYETVTETITAAPESNWSSESGKGIFRFYTVGFNNASNPKRYVDGAIKKAEAWEQDFMGDLPCEKCGLSVNISKNKFGLYDGAVTVQASWPGTAGRNFTSGGVSYYVEDMKVTPMYTIDPDNDKKIIAVSQIIKTRTPCTFYVGYGFSGLASKLRSNNVHPGSNFHYSPSNGSWSATIYGEQQWEVSYERAPESISFVEGY